MAQKKKIIQKFKQPAQLSDFEKANKALREQRPMAALEIAQKLYREQPSEVHKKLLLQAMEAQARFLAQKGNQEGLNHLIPKILQLFSNNDQFFKFAKFLAALGQIQQALEVANYLEDPNQKNNIIAMAVDEAVSKGANARKYLPDHLHQEFDAILQAFAHCEKSEDEKVRELLQGIGLKSPFLEWKLLLRGLLAHYQGDGSRALDNLQRLDPQRLPFQLAAPIRFSLDPQFAKMQPPQQQHRLQRQADSLRSDVILEQLREIQKLISNEESFPAAFRCAEKLRPFLKEQAPDLWPKLANCFYWAITDHGRPEDVFRYSRLFGEVPQDPNLNRLEAMTREEIGEHQVAHDKWKSFLKSVETGKNWPSEHIKYIKALVWQRMGDNARHVEEIRGEDKDLPHFLRDSPNRPKLLNPGAIDCYKQSLAFDPSNKQTYFDFLSCLRGKSQPELEEKILRQMVEHLPKEFESREMLGDLLFCLTRYKEAIEEYQQARHLNPLEQRLIKKLANANLYYARQLAENQQYEEARSAYQASLAHNTFSSRYSVLCKWAACEFKSGNPARGEELLQEALTSHESKLAIIFSFLIELIRLKLNKLKTKYNKEFNSLLKEAPTPAGATSLALTASIHRLAGVKYLGQQTHEKKVLTYLKAAARCSFTEIQLKEILESLVSLQAPQNMMEDYLRRGQVQFPNNPYFYLAEAEYYLKGTGKGYHIKYQIHQALEKARQLTDALPRGEERENFNSRIDSCFKELVSRNPFMSILSGMGGGSPFGDFGFFDDQDWGEGDFDEDEDNW